MGNTCDKEFSKVTSFCDLCSRHLFNKINFPVDGFSVHIIKIDKNFFKMHKKFSSFHSIISCLTAFNVTFDRKFYYS